MIRFMVCLVSVLFSVHGFACEDFSGFYSFPMGESLKLTQQGCEYVLFEFESEGKTDSVKFEQIGKNEKIGINYALFDGRFLTLSGGYEKNNSVAIVFSLDPDRNISAKSYFFDEKNNIVKTFESKLVTK